MYQKVLEGNLFEIVNANEPVQRMSAAIYGTGEPTGEAHDTYERSSLST